MLLRINHIFFLYTGLLTKSNKCIMCSAIISSCDPSVLLPAHISCCHTSLALLHTAFQIVELKGQMSFSKSQHGLRFSPTFIRSANKCSMGLVGKAWGVLMQDWLNSAAGLPPQAQTSLLSHSWSFTENCWPPCNLETPKVQWQPCPLGNIIYPNSSLKLIKKL